MALQELIYTSLAGNHASEEDVYSILNSSERNNVATGVTGLLLFDGERYIQILEGQPDKVDTLFDTIQADPRHIEIEMLHKGPVGGRAFSTWRMAYEALPPGLLNYLAENLAVFAMESDGSILATEESFGGRLNLMFMDAIAAE